MKRIILFLAASLLLISESAIVFVPEKPEVQATIQTPWQKLAIQRVFSTLPGNLSYIPIYLRTQDISVTYSVSGYVTAADIEVRVWAEVGGQVFNHTIPAGTFLDAPYDIPYPSDWLKNGGLKPTLSKIWLIVNPTQNGLQIDISEIATPLDEEI